MLHGLQKLRNESNSYRSISVSSVPITLVPFYRDYLIDMQNSRSDPSIQPCLTLDSYRNIRPRDSQNSCSNTVHNSMQGNSRQNIAQAINGGQKWSTGALLTCITEGSSSTVKRRLQGRNKKQDERKWVKNNFPKHAQSSPQMCSCVVVQTEEQRSTNERVVGREVAPNQFVLSFTKTSGGITYTLGPERGGRGFFVHPPASARRHPTLKVMNKRLNEAHRRRQDFLDDKVERARSMAVLRRRAILPDSTDSETVEPVLELPQVATRGACSEHDVLPKKEEEMSPKKKRRSKRKKPDKSTRRSSSERSLWHRVSALFAGKQVQKQSSKTHQHEPTIEQTRTSNAVGRAEMMSLSESQWKPKQQQQQLTDLQLQDDAAKEKKRAQRPRPRPHRRRVRARDGAECAPASAPEPASAPAPASALSPRP